MLIVSNYHYVRESFETPYPSIFGLTPKELESQLLKIKDKANIISPNELLTNFKEIVESKEKYVLITLDDGLKEQYLNALPVFNDLQIQALFFINSINYIEKQVSNVHRNHLLRSVLSPSDIIDQFKLNFPKINLSSSEEMSAISHYNFDDAETAKLKYLVSHKINSKQQDKFLGDLFEKRFNESDVVADFYMEINQLKKLAKNGQLGSHTHSHLPIGTLDEADMKMELLVTKKYLDKISGDSMKFVSYPYGNKAACAYPVAKIASEIGYKIGFTMERKINCTNVNPLMLGRFDCNDLIEGKNDMNIL